MNRWRMELRYLLGNTPWDSGVSPPELQSLLARRPPGRALDVGCGTGTNLATFAEHGWEPWGIDISQIAVWKARMRLARRGLSAHVQRGDITLELTFPEPFEMVLDLGCSHALQGVQRAAFAENLQRWLRPGGTLLVYSFYRPEGENDGRWLSFDEVVSTFSPMCEVKSVEKGDFRGRSSAWLTLVRPPA
jgi:SAM-dependent methyltransferase